MKFHIEEIVPTSKGGAEVRARLEDGRLACIAADKGSDKDYEAAVSKYLAEAFPPEPAEGETSEE